MWAETTRWLSEKAGSAAAFIIALSLVLLWLISGFFVGFGNTLYQLIINTATTIITFLMVFVLQNTQNRDTIALHAKLDELIRSSGARNEMAGIEKLPEAELREAAEK